jgi:hypothetical protein
MAEDAAPGLGEGRLAAADPAVDQPQADQLLKGSELLANGRLAVAELAGGAGERSLLGDGLQRQ